MNFSHKMQAVVACLLWGSAFAGAKMAFEYCPPIMLSGLRFTLAGLILIPVMIVMKVNFREAMRHWRFMLVFALLQTFLQYGLFFMGLSRVPAAMTAIIIGAGPLFVTVMAHFVMRDDRMTARKTAAILLGLAGVAFISMVGNGRVTGGGGQFWWGVALLVVSNIVGSYTNIMVVRRKDLNISPVALTAFANFTGGVGLLVAALIVEEPIAQAPPAVFWAGLLWLAIIPAGAFSLWYNVLQSPGVKVSELNAWKFLTPVFGCILAWVLLSGESPDWTQLTGIAIIVAALCLLQERKNLPK